MFCHFEGLAQVPRDMRIILIMEGMSRLICPNENKLLVIQELASKFESLEIDPRVPSADVAQYLSLILQLHVLSSENNQIPKVHQLIFSKEFVEIVELQFDNFKAQRNKRLNQNQTRCLVKAFPMLEVFKVSALDMPQRQVSYWTEGFKQLKILHIYLQNNFNDDLFEYVAQCTQLREFGVGGRPDDFNRLFTAKGFQKLSPLKENLRVLSIQYASQIGDKALKIISEHLTHLTSLQIKRNCFDTSEDITDEGIISLGQVQNLEKLSLIYCRNFGQNISINLSENLLNIKYLCLRSCPIFQEVDVLSKLTKLEELDLGGDSWVRPKVLIGISKLKLKIFHLGHYDHGQTSCQQIIASYPPEGIFVHNLFKTQKVFAYLEKLYLQQCCTLTFWLDVRIKLSRPTLQILYRQKQQFQ